MTGFWLWMKGGRCRLNSNQDERQETTLRPAKKLTSSRNKGRRTNPELFWIAHMRPEQAGGVETKKKALNAKIAPFLLGGELGAHHQGFAKSRSSRGTVQHSGLCALGRSGASKGRSRSARCLYPCTEVEADYELGCRLREVTGKKGRSGLRFRYRPRRCEGIFIRPVAWEVLEGGKETGFEGEK